MCDKQQYFENLRAEYSALIDYHNSIVTHRFTLLGFFLATVGIIIQNGVTPQDALLIIALTITLYIIERRNRVLYTQMGKRAMEIENVHWDLIRYKNEHEIIELPLFCRFRSKELREKLGKKLSDELEKEITTKPKFLDKVKISFLPASHSVGLDWLYLSVAFYAVGHLFYYIFKC
jgi:uncharacterized membrane protein YqaE (UPF0057 family)